MAASATKVKSLRNGSVEADLGCAGAGADVFVELGDGCEDDEKAPIELPPMMLPFDVIEAFIVASESVFSRRNESDLSWNIV